MHDNSSKDNGKLSRVVIWFWPQLSMCKKGGKLCILVNSLHWQYSSNKDNGKWSKVVIWLYEQLIILRLVSKRKELILKIKLWWQLISLRWISQCRLLIFLSLLLEQLICCNF